MALGPREAYASWFVRPDDWLNALEWLGPQATQATLFLRLRDITDLNFDGTNAHTTWDLDLVPGEHDRPVPLDAPSRSLAAVLEVRSPRGYFHPIAHADLVHPPREEATQFPASQHLHVLPRW